MSELVPVLGVLAGVVGRRRHRSLRARHRARPTRPHRGTWLIWGVLASSCCLSQRADGASWSLVMVAAQAG